MKKVIFIICAVFAGVAANAQQAAIGTQTLNKSAILEFKAGDKSGLVLPWVTTLPTGAALTGGVMLYDTTDNKVKYYTGEKWINLSKAGTVNVPSQAALAESTRQGTIIGAQESDAEGVLVLEATDKALILPKMASPQTAVIKPMAGTICYDTVKKEICVFNGTEWTFWR
ncbi:hypothetical protein [Flavobacterium chungangensis]|uniref:Uncharacterized protein n=1 Tax=Flavobacterium chungangensis TaxID=2708132 RepID=A0ABV8Z9S0_9FLAO